MTDKISPGRPAATVIIMRDSPRARAEILMVERAKTMAFAGGALVFPGGGVDESDRTLAATFGGPLALDETAARIAAIRETLEECGLAIAMAPVPDETMRVTMRQRLAAGATLEEAMAEHGLSLALEELVPFARWHPAANDRVSRIYDTRFYVARAPEGQIATADGTENVHLFWSEAAALLARCKAGAVRLIYPTRRNLERLAQFEGFADVAAHAASISVRRITPWIEEHDGERRLCIPDDLGYPVTWEPLETVQRS